MQGHTKDGCDEDAMVHLNETTLELFLLGAKEVESQRGEIESHLRECEGCREQYEDISQFYEGVRSELASREAPSLIERDLQPIRQRRGAVNRVGDRAAVSQVVETALPVRVARWVIQHPYVASGGTLLAIGMLAGLFVSNLRRPKEPVKDMNPVSVRLAGEMFLLQNKYAETIGELHVGEPTVSDARAAERYGYTFAGFADIDGDERNEVFWARNPETEIDSSAVVYCQRVADIKPLWAVSIRQRLAFEHPNSVLKGRYRIRRVEVGDYDADGVPEVYVVAYHDWSPSLIRKLDGRTGKELGTYVHAGHINTLSAFDFDGDGRRELLLAGANNGFHSAFVAVLDPRFISGYSQAAEGRIPQGMHPANERAYVLLPMTRAAKAMHPDDYSQARIERMSLTDTSFIAIVDDRVPDPIGDQSAIIYLTFEKGLRCISAVPSERYRFLYGELVRGGKIPDQALEEYLQEYIRSFLYWDGERWVNAPTWNMKYSKPPS
jgi:hypothetical protein